MHVRTEMGVVCGGKHKPAVNIPSGDPRTCKSLRQRAHPMAMNSASCIIPPAVSCLYSVMRRLSAVAFPALEFICRFPVLQRSRRTGGITAGGGVPPTLDARSHDSQPPSTRNSCRSWNRRMWRSTSESTRTSTRFQ